MIQKIRVPLGFAIALVVFYLAAPTGKSMALGLPVAAVGFIFRFFAAGVIRKDSMLATSGLYSWTRNPLYFGSFMLSLGSAIMSGSGIAIVGILAASAWVYPDVIRNEEQHLERLFPNQFPQYRRQIPRFVPRLGSFENSFSFQQYLKNREYNTALGLLLVVGVFLYKWLHYL